MEELSKERGLPPQLLNLIPDERDWKTVREGGEDGGRSSRACVAIFGADAEELELKLGLPGVQPEDDGESCSALSLGCFPAHSRLASTGAKRGFFDTVEAKPQGRTECKSKHVLL
jgi:auxin-responsive protein IAA